MRQDRSALDVPRRREWLAAGATLLVAALLRASLLPTPDHEDLWIYKKWALQAARGGLHSIYEGNREAWPTREGIWYGGYLCDYPPVIPALLGAAGGLTLAVEPRAGETDSFDSRAEEVFAALVKLPALLFDLGIAAILFISLGRSAPFAPAYAVLILYAFNPAVVFDVAYWGGPDSIHTLFALVALLAVSRTPGRPLLAGAAAALAACSKPQGTVYLPLVFAVLAGRGGSAAVRRMVAGAALATGAVLAPFVLHGTFGDFVWTQTHTVGMQPTLSNNAHNLWWLASGGSAARILDSTHLLPGVTFQAAGLALFLVVFGAILARAYRAGSTPARLPALFALAAATVYMLPTEIHENHLFAALPLLLAPPMPGRGRLLLFAGFTITQTANLLLHDEYISGLLAPGFGESLRWLGVANAAANTALYALACLRILGSASAAGTARPGPLAAMRGARWTGLALGTHLAALGLAGLFARWVVLKPPCTAPCSVNGSYLERKEAGWPMGPVWNLNRNGAVSQRFRVSEPGAHEIRVRVKPRPAGSEPPLVEIRCDGRTILRESLLSTRSRDLRAVVDLDPGLHRVEVAFLNDFAAPPLDRDVEVAEVALGAARGGRPHPPVLEDAP